MTIQKKSSSPYRPQTNGLVERTNRTLTGILSKIAFRYPTKRDEYLDIVRFNYNIRYQENLKASPFELIYGRLLNLPNTMLINNNKEKYTMDRIKRISKIQEELMIKRNVAKRKNRKEI